MANRKIVTLTLLCIIVSCVNLGAQETNCAEIVSIAKVARASTIASMNANSKKAGDSYRARLVLAARRFELAPLSKNAAAVLLGFIPQNDEQQTVWMTLGDSLCDSEPVREMLSLSRVRDRLARDLAQAVLLVPGNIHAYLAYAAKAVGDPHSDYAMQMQRVCHAKYAAFTNAVRVMAPDDRAWFISHIFEPTACKPLALPEAD